MRIESLTLTNVKHLDHVTVDLSGGISIIEGPNGAGKSTLMEAFEALRTCKDSSDAAAVARLRPSGRDVLPTVQATVSFGEQRLTYSKTFGKKRDGGQTTLQRDGQSTPMTGDEAHDAFAALFASHADVDLWNVMRIQEGVLTDADWGTLPSLSSVLDELAPEVTQTHDDTVIDRARAWATTWLTSTGRRNSDAKAREAALAQAQEHAAQAQQRAEQHDVTLETLREARGRKSDLAEQRDGLGERLAAAREHAAQRAAREAEFTAAAERREALTERAAADHEKADRYEAALAAKAEAEASRTALDDEITQTQQALTDLVETEREQLDVKATATTALDDARNLREQAETSSDAVQARTQIPALEKRLEDFDDQLTALRELEQTVAASPVTDVQLRTLESLQTAVDAAERTAQSAATTFEYTAAEAVTITVGKQTHNLAADETLSLAVTEVLTLTGPFGRVVLTPPADVARALLDARTARDRAFHDAEVESIDQARERAAEHREALAARDALRTQIGADATSRRQAMQDALTAATTAAAAVSDDKDLPTVDQARAAESRAAASLRDADEHLAATVQRRVQTEATLVTLRERHASQAKKVVDATVAMRAITDGLPAEATEDTVTWLRQRAQQALRQAEQLAIPTPSIGETVDDVARLEKRLKEMDGELHDAALKIGRLEQAVIDGRDVEGALVAARERAEAAQRDVDEMQAQIDASTLLVTALEEARARRAATHAAPFAQEVVRLGRMLYTDGFDVDIDDELRITHARIGGRHLAAPDPSARDPKDKEFGQLSKGQVEQIAVLQRLAVASLVARADGDAATEGMPVWLDDVLVYSDAFRMRRMQAVLEDVARRAQVVVLTANPTRAAEITGATRISLGSAAALAAFDQANDEARPEAVAAVPSTRKKPARGKRAHSGTDELTLTLDLEAPAQTEA